MPLRILTVMTPLAGPGQPVAGYAAAEAAARRSAADLSRHLGQTCLQLRRPASIVHGFAEYYRSQDSLPPAGLDQMLERLTDEITRMETLAEALRTYSASEPARPGRQPEPPSG